MQGRPAPAFELLRRLAGKIVDPQVFELFQREITLDAVASHQNYEAIAYMDSWLRNADEDDREVARAEIPKALRAMPTDVLENSLRAMRANETPSGYGTSKAYRSRRSPCRREIRGSRIGSSIRAQAACRSWTATQAFS